jgi:hypothetical protein
MIERINQPQGKIKRTFISLNRKGRKLVPSIISCHNDPLLEQQGVAANGHHGHVGRRLQPVRQVAGLVLQKQMWY